MGGDKPEFVLYLPGRGGNLGLGLVGAGGAIWLHHAERVTTRYRPGELLYEIRDPLLGASGVFHLTVVALHQTEGVILRAEARGATPGLTLVWAYGGVTGERGRRDGDIGTEDVPIREWFQLRPEFCRDNLFTLGATGFTLTAGLSTLTGLVPEGAHVALGDATAWNDLPGLLASASPAGTDQPLVIARAPLKNGQPLLLSIQRPPVSDRSDLPRLFAEARAHFSALRTRVSVDTPRSSI